MVEIENQFDIIFYMKFQEIVKFLNRDISTLSQIFKKTKKRKRSSKNKKTSEIVLVVLVLVFFSLGIFWGVYFSDFIKKSLEGYLGIFSKENFQPQVQIKQEFPEEKNEEIPYSAQTSQEEAVINVVESASPAVVSIIISKEVPVYEEYYESPLPGFPGFPEFPEFRIPKYRQKGTKKQNVGSGTGFIVSEDGLLITNKHVVSDDEAEYTIVTNTGEKYEVEVLARDPFQDLAVLKIKKKKDNGSEGGILQEKFPVVRLGDSSNIRIGQTVVAIGNALGEFKNTVSVGVVSGLGRTITASGGGMVETLEDVIQTDAAVNRGNSGGPLLNLKGEVIGVNVAVAEAAENIGFAIPINKAKRDINQIKTIGKIVYPFLGIRYILITPEIQEERKLKIDYGVLIVRGETVSEPAVVPGSGAEKAGLKEGDIILEVNKEKITPRNSLAKIIQNYNPGDKIILKVLRGEETMEIQATLGEKASD